MTEATLNVQGVLGASGRATPPPGLVAKPAVIPTPPPFIANCSTSPALTLSPAMLRLQSSMPHLEPLSVEYQRIQRIAEENGYKVANLTVFSEMLSQISGLHNRVAIPDYVGISSEEMYRILGSSFRETIHQLWQEFKIDFRSNSNTITPRGLSILTQIQAAIERGFEQFSEDQLGPLLNLKLSQFPSQYVIVRSTGYEDSLELTNAGGNVSIPFVAKNLGCIKNAIKNVIKSYFSETSIRQVLKYSENLIILDKPPFIPVLIQNMLGCETPTELLADPKKIMKSGVLLLQKSKGGIPIIQAAPGNNEGIVGNQVIADTLYVGKQGTIFSDVKHKPRLLALANPTTGEIGPMTMPKEIENTPTLDPTILLDLKLIAETLVELYKWPSIDIEFTVSPDNTLNILQIRPSKRKKPKSNPNYIKPEYIERTIPARKFEVESLSTGGGYVRKIINPSQIIFADTLNLAQKEYVRRSGTSVQCVVVREEANKNSHAAVNFNADQIPIILVSDKEKFNSLEDLSLKTSEHNFLLLDTQQGVFIHSSTDLETEQGFISFAIPNELSIMPTEDSLRFQQTFDRPADFATFMGAYFRKINDLETNLLAGGQLIDEPNKNLLHILATNTKNSKRALASILHKLRTDLHKILTEEDPQTKMLLKDEILKLFNLIDFIFLLSTRELLPALDQVPSPRSRENPFHTDDRLFPIKLLEIALLKNSSDIINGHSVVSVLKQIEQKKAFITQNIKFQKFYLQNTKYFQLHCLEKEIVSEETRTLWGKFLFSLAEPDLEKIYNSLNKFKELKILPTWLNIIFRKKIESPSFRAELMVQELQEVLTRSPILNEIQQRSEEIDQIQVKKEEFASLSSAREVWVNLERILKTEGLVPDGVTYQPFHIKFQRANELEKLILIQRALDLIELLDQSIKIMKSSLEIPDIEKLERFKIMLSTYRMIVDSISRLPDLESLFPLGRNFADYLGFIDNGRCIAGAEGTIRSKGFRELIATSNPDELKPTPDFNVNSVLPSTSYSEMQYPTKLDDYFTTFHQICLQVLNFNLTKFTEPEKVLPAPVNLILDRFKRINSKVFITGINFVGKEVVITFNYRMNNHGINFRLRFNSEYSEKPIKLEAQVFGFNTDQRWDEFASIAAITPQLLNLEESSIPPEIDYKETAYWLKWNWQLSTNPTILERQIEGIARIIDILDKRANVNLSVRKNFLGVLTLQETPQLEPPELDRLLKQPFWQRVNFFNTPRLNIELLKLPVVPPEFKTHQVRCIFQSLIFVLKNQLYDYSLNYSDTLIKLASIKICELKRANYIFSSEESTIISQILKHTKAKNFEDHEIIALHQQFPELTH